MHLPYAIERHRQPLLGIVATLYAMIGLAEGGMVERLSWPLYRAVLALLRPAESAVRRLIVAAAHGLVLKQRASRPAPAKPVTRGKRHRRRSFALFDPRMPQVDRNRRFIPTGPKVEPRIHFFGVDPLSPLYRRSAQATPEPKPPRDDTVNSGPLCRRLAAILDALKDPFRQARRYARWRAKAAAERRLQPDTVLRRGPPPGLRKNSSHEVHAILKECDWLARSVAMPDTS